MMFLLEVPVWEWGSMANPSLHSRIMIALPSKKNKNRNFFDACIYEIINHL